MAALTRSRDTKRYGQEGRKHYLKMKAATKAFQGSLVVDDAGFLAPGRTATGLKALGRLETGDVDNSAGAAGDKTGEYLTGIFKWANSAAGDLIAQADVGNVCYVVDDQTVAKTDGTGTRSAAGRIINVDTDGVWVQMGFEVL